MSFNETNQWLKDSAYEWYALPRVRIDSAYAADYSHINEEVCKIVFTGWGGNVEAEFVLKVSSFKKDFSTSYNGNYMESFYDGDILKYLTIEQSKLRNFTQKDSVFDWSALCKCDIKVYWSGKCDMWIDRVRIENRPAHQYLTLKEGWLYEKMKKEIEWSGRNYSSGNPIPNYFYFEECQMSHFPMISALNKQIMDSTGNKNELVVWLNYDLFKAHVPNCWQYQFSADMLKTYLYDDFGIKTLVMGAYSLEGFELPDGRSSYHPNSLSTASYNKYSGVLSYPASPGEYDNWLQDNTDNKIGGTGLIYMDKRIDELSRKGFKIIDCVQAHGWHSVSHKLKEPTNQELEFQACLALSYNAKGIIYFSYTSTRENDTVYGLCITNYPDLSLRTNVYGQSKLEGISSLNTKLIKWGPHVLNFNPDETKTCIYRNQTERSNFLNSTYFSVITTYFSSPYSQCYEITPSTSSEPQTRTYIQATTFKKLNEQNTNYFMILNRRCTPGDDDCSGRRYVAIDLDSLSSEFSGFNNWQIIDLGNDSLITTFDSRKRNAISLGKYKPGEGKLYKIIPSIPNGGTLVADETISGNVNCNGMIYNGGHNITISPNAVVTFSDSAGIEMNVGSFVSNVNADNIEPVTLTGKTSSTFWKGITLIGCDSIGVYNTNISNIKANDTAKAFSIINSYKVNFRRNTINANSNSGGIQAVYNSFSDNLIVFNVRECNFNMNQSGYSAISVLSNASVTLPIVTEWCLFNSQNDTSNAILFNEVTGGAIKNNTFTNFGKSVVLMYSTTDLYGNTILGKDNSQ